MYHILLVEDDAVEADVLRAHISRYGQEIGEQFDVTWLRSSLDVASGEKSYDLIFMDIDLPGMNGLDVARLIRSYDPHTPLIFVTNLSQYAIRGYEVDAIDFIVKPVSYGSFRMRMSKGMRYVRRQSAATIAVPVSRDETKVLALCEITAIEVRNHELTYHLAQQEEPINAYGSLSRISERLEEGGFVRISKSCFVNMAHIRSYAGSSIAMQDGSRYPLSRAMRKDAISRITRYVGGSL